MDELIFIKLGQDILYRQVRFCFDESQNKCILSTFLLIRFAIRPFIMFFTASLALKILLSL